MSGKAAAPGMRQASRRSLPASCPGTGGRRFLASPAQFAMRATGRRFIAPRPPAKGSRKPCPARHSGCWTAARRATGRSCRQSHTAPGPETASGSASGSGPGHVLSSAVHDACGSVRDRAGSCRLARTPGSGSPGNAQASRATGGIAPRPEGRICGTWAHSRARRAGSSARPGHAMTAMGGQRLPGSAAWGMRGSLAGGSATAMPCSASGPSASSRNRDAGAETAMSARRSCRAGRRALASGGTGAGQGRDASAPARQAAGASRTGVASVPCSRRRSSIRSAGAAATESRATEDPVPAFLPVARSPSRRESPGHIKGRGRSRYVLQYCSNGYTMKWRLRLRCEPVSRIQLRPECDRRSLRAASRGFQPNRPCKGRTGESGMSFPESGKYLPEMQDNAGGAGSGRALLPGTDRLRFRPHHECSSRTALEEMELGRRECRLRLVAGTPGKGGAARQAAGRNRTTGTLAKSRSRRAGRSRAAVLQCPLR